VLTRFTSDNRRRKGRGRLAADDRRSLVDELVVLESLDHEQGKVHPARDVALEDRVAYVSAPHWETLGLALFEVTPADDGPARFACKHSPARLDLVVEVSEARKTRERAGDLHDRLELPGVHVLAVARDVPSAREDEACPWGRVVKNRLGRSRRVPVDAPWDEHDEHSVASLHGAFDDIAVIGRSRNDGDPPPERIELFDALLAAHSHHFVAAVERVLDHVLPELPRGSDDADLR
jgi:hypothetical protein